MTHSSLGFLIHLVPLLYTCYTFSLRVAAAAAALMRMFPLWQRGKKRRIRS